MFNKENLVEYKKMILSIAMFSRLSSESLIPYLGYRSVENIFCRAFNAKNVSRIDCSVDAIKDNVGYGIKTFLEGNGKTLQKVAEFNSDANKFREKTYKEVVESVARLRNDRIEFTKRLYGLNEVKYHCVVRAKGNIKVFECNMDLINIRGIKNIKPSGVNVIQFEDGINEYSFNLSKSTLYKRFITDKVLLQFNVKILEDPYIEIMKLLEDDDISKFASINEERECIFLPLYSKKGGIHVPERSGLNQWNAKGRSRDFNEVYIPIPAWIHKEYPDFFPDRDKHFKLLLPDGKKLDAKVCQDGSKALMTNPNRDLGKWILRQVLNLKEGELLVYSTLEELGIDSVVLYKESIDIYSINFCEIGTFEKFKKIYKEE